jgi:hypothetical protein
MNPVVSLTNQGLPATMEVMTYRIPNPELLLT